LFSYAVCVASSTACASSTQAPAATEVRKPEPPAQAAPPPPPPPKPPSAYEKRWQNACTDPEASGHCPAPFDRPGVFFDAGGSADYAPPSLCDVGDRTADAATLAALNPKRKALRACLRGAAHGAWVDVVSDGSRPANAAAGVSARSIACVTKLVQRALPNDGPASVKRVVLLNVGDPRKDA
jgi:hypothetical protein